MGQPRNNLIYAETSSEVTFQLLASLLANTTGFPCATAACRNRLLELLLPLCPLVRFNRSHRKNYFLTLPKTNPCGKKNCKPCRRKSSLCGLLLCPVITRRFVKADLQLPSNYVFPLAEQSEAAPNRGLAILSAPSSRDAALLNKCTLPALNRLLKTLCEQIILKNNLYALNNQSF